MWQHAARALPSFVLAGLGPRGLVSRVRRRVRLSETDFNMHMNQAAYAQVAEFGRNDWVLRSGLVRTLWRARTKPIMAEQRIVYRRELKPGQRYEMDTRATGLDGRLLKVDAHLIVDDRVHAAIYAKLISIGPGGVLSPEAAQSLLSAFVTDALPVDDWRVIG